MLFVGRMERVLEKQMDTHQELQLDALGNCSRWAILEVLRRRQNARSARF